MIKGNTFTKYALAIIKSKLFILASEFLTSIIVSRYLGPEGKGLYTSILVYPLLIISLIDMGIQKATISYFKEYGDKENEILSSLVILWMISSFFGVLVCNYLYSISTNLLIKPEMILLAISLIPLRLSNSYLMGVLLSTSGMRMFSAFQTFPFLSKFGFILFFVVGMNWGLYGVLVSHLLASFLAFLILLRYLSCSLSKFTFIFSPSVILSLISYGIFHSAALFLLNLNYKIDTILIGSMSSNYELGQYSTGVSVVELLWQVPAALEMLVFHESVTSSDKKNSLSRITRLVRITFWISIILGFLLALSSSQVISLLFGNEFSKSSQVLQILVPGIILFSSVRILYMDISGGSSPGALIYLLIIPLVINIISNVLFVPIYGAIGAALSSTISYSLASALFIGYFCRKYKVNPLTFYKFKKSDYSFLSSV